MPEPQARKGSSFNVAVARVLAHEGGAKIYANRETGEYSKYGVSLKFLKTILPSAVEDDITCMTESDARAIYRAYFWDDNRLGEIENQPLATAVLDITVNMGPGSANRDGGITLLQKTLNQLRMFADLPLVIDGKVGNKTITAANRAIPEEALKLYVEHVKLRYQVIAANNPKIADNLAGWINRAESLLV